MSSEFSAKKNFMDSHVPGFCAIIRHGERADNIDNAEELGIKIETKYDPPLTPHGIQ